MPSKIEIREELFHKHTGDVRVSQPRNANKSFKKILHLDQHTFGKN